MMQPILNSIHSTSRATSTARKSSTDVHSRYLILEPASAFSSGRNHFTNRLEIVNQQNDHPMQKSVNLKIFAKLLAAI
jgi:hypothetical protein